MGKDIKQTVISHDDWFKPVNEIAGCRYLKWDKERFSFAVSYDEEVVRRLEQSTFLQQRLWAPAAQAYKDMIRNIAADAREADSKIKAHLVAFEADLDWDKFVKLATAQKEAFAATVIATQRSTIARMKGEIERVWGAKTRQNRALSPYKMKVIVENGVRINGVSLLLDDLHIPLIGEIGPWQDALKEGMRCCLDFSRQGKGIDRFVEEIQRDLGELRNVITPARSAMMRPENTGRLLITLVGQAGVSTIQKSNKMLRFLKARLVALKDLSERSVEAVGNGQEAACGAETAARAGQRDLIRTSTEDLAALDAAIRSIGARIERCVSFEQEARQAIEATVNASDRDAVEAVLGQINSVIESGSTAVEVRSRDWDGVNLIATRVIGYAVTAARDGQVGGSFRDPDRIATSIAG